MSLQRFTRFALAAALTCMAAVSQTSDTYACGGCFTPTETFQVVTDHRMVLAVHENETILWDQIRYTGRPEEFSWVLPVQGDVRLETASGDFFDWLDATTAVRVSGPPIATQCNSGGFGPRALAANNSTDSTSQNPPNVQVLREEVVGPYQTVTLRSTDSMALTTWLTNNGYAIPPAIQPVIDAYTTMHMDFIALRLLPGEGVQSMQPIRIRYASANMVLPLRMVAAGVADKVGISLWIFGHGRYQAANFGNGTIDASQLVWDWNTSSSNYSSVFNSTLRGIDGGRAWITEYAQNASSLQWSLQSISYNQNNALSSADITTEWNIATNHQASGIWITKMRSDLLARYLDTDLQIEAATTNSTVSNSLFARQETGRRPEPVCPPSTGLGFGPGGALLCSAGPVGTTQNQQSPGTKLILGSALALTVVAALRVKRSKN